MMQESLDFVRKVSDPASAASWQAVADLAGRWSSRWPSMQQGSSAAALTVIYSRDIALQSVAAELAKTAQVPHKVILAGPWPSLGSYATGLFISEVGCNLLLTGSLQRGLSITLDSAENSTWSIL